MRKPFLKRPFDFILSIIGMVISFPLWLISGFAIWLEDKGGIFYLQERIGKNSRFFKVIKFRSMREESGNNSRITNVGRILRVTALDELPQLINILKGDMSFVGPRPPVPQEVQLGQEELRIRFTVRPGLTGVAQILLPKEAPILEKAQYDIWYIKNQSFSLDLYLIFLSFLVTFRGRWEVKRDKFDFLAKGLKQRIETQIR